MKKQAVLALSGGMDSSTLLLHLLEKEYEVHGIVRPSSTFNRGRIDHIYLKDEIW